MELTIDQLAQRVEMSTRNIREWQRQGLIPAPERRGRVGIYSDGHVARIERVKKLQTEGLPLDLIRRLSASNTESEGDIRHLADEVLSPMSTAGSATVTRRALSLRFGDDGAEGLIAMGLVGEGKGADDDEVLVRDVVSLNLIEDLVRIGISPQRMAKALAEVSRLQREIAALIIDVYRDDVWLPFASSGFSTGDWAAIADGVTRAKPVAIQLLGRLLDAAFDDVASTVLLREAAEAERALDQS